MSTLKEITLAQRHLRVPKNIKKNPVLIGHEFSGTIAKSRNKMERGLPREGKQFVFTYQRFLINFNFVSWPTVDFEYMIKNK